jgi:hypothetical protein
MKSKSFLTAILIISLSTTVLNACSKKKEDANCKTCRAFTVDDVKEEEVCSEAEETAFRNKYAGREISCQ